MEDLTLMSRITSHKQLRVYQAAMDAAMRIFQLMKRFPVEERYSLTDQIRRASRSVCSNIGESWRKRRYRAAFVSKLSDSETEAEETRVWLEFSWRCGYISKAEADDLDERYDHILAQLVLMIDRPEQWLITARKQDPA
jgi:four helix bundle protein